MPSKKELPKEKGHAKLTKKPGNGNVSCSLLDKSGNLWFGTSDDGLYKYDGKTFSQYVEDEGLSSMKISCLLEDNSCRIWIGTEAGPCFYDGKTFTPIKIPLPKNLPPNQNQLYSHSHWVYSMLQAKDGKIWFVTIDGVYIYDGKSPLNGQAGFTPFLITEAVNTFWGSNDKVERILEDNAGNIWLGGRTNKGIFRYDGKMITHYPLPEITLQFESRQVSHSWGWPQVVDKNGNIWFSNWAGAYRYDGKTFTSITKSDGLPGYNGLVTKIIADKKGNLWLGGDGGLSRYDGKSFTSYIDGLINPWIWTILEDKTGNIWVGTRESGLYLFDGKAFINYSEVKQ